MSYDCFCVFQYVAILGSPFSDPTSMGVVSVNHQKKDRICKKKSKIFNRWTIVADWLVNRWSDRKRKGMFETQAEFSSAARSTFWFWRKWTQPIFVVRVVALINSWTGTSWGALGGTGGAKCPSCPDASQKAETLGIRLSQIVQKDIVGSNRLLGTVSVIETDPSPTLPSRCRSLQSIWSPGTQSGKPTGWLVEECGVLVVHYRANITEHMQIIFPAHRHFFNGLTV